MKRKIIIQSILLFAAILFASCSGDKRISELLEQIPANTDIVAVGDLKTVIESAGGSTADSKIKLPSALEDLLSSSEAEQFDKINSFMRDAGVDANACAVAGNFKDKQPTIVFTLTDRDKFVKAIEDEDFNETDKSGDVTYYKKRIESEYDTDYDDFSYIAVKGSYAYYIDKVWRGSDFKPQRALERMFDDIKDEGSYADTPFGDYIADGNAFGVAIKLPSELRKSLREAGVPSSLADLYNGVVCIKGNVSDDTFTATVKLFDENGKDIDVSVMKDWFDMSARINSDALAYMSSDECLVYAASLKNVKWDNYFDLVSASLSPNDRAALAVVKGYFERFDGTIAVGMGLTDGLQSVVDLNMPGSKPFEAVALTLVAETKEGKAKSSISDIKALLDSSKVPYTSTANGISIDLDGVKVNLSAEGNMIVLSNKAIKKYGDNPAVKAIDFAKYIGAAAFVVGSDSKIARDLKLKNSLTATITSDPRTLEGTLTVKITGDDAKGVVARFIDICQQIANNSKDVADKINQARDSYYTDYWVADSAAADYVYVDSAAVDYYD